jgi:hypothetical protein
MLYVLFGCIGLDATGKAPAVTTAALGEITLGATTLDFGTVDPGSEHEQVLTLQSRSSEMVTVNALVDGDPAFTIPVDTLAVFEGDTLLTVRFAPASDGDYTGALRLSNDRGDTAEVALLGIAGSGGSGGDTGGGDASLVVSTRSHDFGELELGASDTHTFTLRNDGSAPVELAGIATSDGAFEVGGIAANATLAPGSSGEVEVTFTPTRAQAYTGTITVTSNAADSPLTLDVRGRGAQGCTVCEPRIDVDTGGDPYAITDFFTLGSPDRRTITVSNLGDVDLRVTDVFVNNDAIATCGEFVVGGWSGAQVVAAGRRLSFTVAYEITDNCLDLPVPELDSNMLHILSNDPYEPDWAIQLQGTGIAF